MEKIYFQAFYSISQMCVFEIQFFTMDIRTLINNVHSNDFLYFVLIIIQQSIINRYFKFSPKDCNKIL